MTADSIIDMPVPPVGRWHDPLTIIRRLQGRSAYVFNPPLTQSEIWTLRSSARWQGMTLHVRQSPPGEPVETRVWFKGEKPRRRGKS